MRVRVCVPVSTWHVARHVALGTEQEHHRRVQAGAYASGGAPLEHAMQGGWVGCVLGCWMLTWIDTRPSAERVHRFWGGREGGTVMAKGARQVSVVVRRTCMRALGAFTAARCVGAHMLLESCSTTCGS